MTKELPSHQHQSLPRRIHAHVCRLLDDVETFEVDPHGVRRIGYSAVRESIGGEKVTEFIIPVRLRNPEYGNQGGTDAENLESDPNEREGFSSRQLTKST